MTRDGVSAKVHADSGSLFSLKVELMLPGLKGWACGKVTYRESQVLPGLSGTRDEGLSVNRYLDCTVKPWRTGLFLIASQSNFEMDSFTSSRSWENMKSLFGCF